jgi:hypothetical protein
MITLVAPDNVSARTLNDLFRTLDALEELLDTLHRKYFIDGGCDLDVIYF